MSLKLLPARLESRSIGDTVKGEGNKDEAAGGGNSDVVC
jgi:hypothetical protein